MAFNNRITGLLIIAALFLWLLQGCNEHKKGQDSVAQQIEIDSAEWVISQSIAFHGGDFENTTLEFDFREKHYQRLSESGIELMTRSFTKGDSIYLDSISSNIVKRYINNRPIDLTKKKSATISSSINSVFYFVMLPAKLSDPAVITDYKGMVNSGGKRFHQVAVSFKEEGGGEDHQDEFFYWFDASNFRLSYLAYAYQTNGGGIRFRSVENEHLIENGYRFQDYVNYKTDSLGTQLEDLLAIYRDSGLLDLSKIRLSQLKVERVK